MSREIKFRAFENKNARGRMFKWDEIKKEFLDYLNCNDTFLMQFTGLLDKNGVEIYEGDIIVFSQSEGGFLPPSTQRGYVEINVSHGVIMRYPCKHYANGLGIIGIYGHVSEIIGNIHENPELL